MADEVATDVIQVVRVNRKQQEQERDGDEQRGHHVTETIGTHGKRTLRRSARFPAEQPERLTGDGELLVGRYDEDRDGGSVG